MTRRKSDKSITAQPQTGNETEKHRSADSGLVLSSSDRPPHERMDKQLIENDHHFGFQILIIPKGHSYIQNNEDRTNER
jgi:hypothetical protein